MPSANVSPEQCFVIMPFGSPFDEYYSEIFRPAIERAGLIAVQAGEIFTPGMFMRQVVDGILSSSIILAELTGRNANVFYELGLAHAYRKPVIMVTQDKDDVPADLQGLRWIGYKTISPRWAEELRNQISDSILSCLRAGPIERMRRFLPGAVQTVDVPAIADRIVDLSPTQRQIFDFLKRSQDFVSQGTLAQEFHQLTGGDLYYRLEVLRLLGLLESKVVDRAGTQFPIYAYRLSPEAEAYVDRYTGR